MMREEFPLMPDFTPLIMYIAFLTAVIITAYGIYSKIRIYRLDGAAKRPNQSSRNLRQVLIEGLLQRRILRRIYAGLMHSTLAYAVIVLTVGTILVMVDLDILRPRGTILLQGLFYLGFEGVLDVFGVVLLLSVLMALYRRVWLKPPHLGRRRGDVAILAGLLYIGVSGFMLEGLRLSVKHVEWAAWSPLGYGASQIFASEALNLEIAKQAYVILWWTHALVAFGMISAIPFSKLAHAPISLANILLQPQRPRGRLSTPFNLMELMESENMEVQVGISGTAELAWTQRMMIDCCTDCGRCEEVCPATAAGRDLSPRELIQDLKDELPKDLARLRAKEKPTDLLKGIVREDEVWACTTCRACVEECPVYINQLDYIVEFRRKLVSESRLAQDKVMLLENLIKHSNPFGFRSSDRERWADGLGVKTLREEPNVEYLFWVGCVCSYDKRGQEVAKALVKVMREAGVSFGILGNEEKCTGDPARRLGEEGRFQEFVYANIETLKRYNVKKIVTACAHCYNTLKNEYPEFGADFEVLHHTQLLRGLIHDGRIKAGKGVKKIVSFHDSCYLGRYNGIYSEPREVLKSIRGLVVRELRRRKDRGFCCGAGGSNYWYKVEKSERNIGDIRIDEGLQTGCEVIAVECPFCMAMFEDRVRVRGLESKLKVKDVVEVVAESM